jgi:hypothetical protein
MKKLIVVLVFLVGIMNLSFADEIKYYGFSMPESVAEGTDGYIYVSEIGEKDKDGD